jgi:hypothetical protein
MLKISRNLALTVILLTTLLLAGCAGAPSSPDQVVKERAEQRWEAIFARDYSKAYEFYSPGYRSQYSAVDLEIALRVQKVRWTSAKYIDHACNEDICKVRFNLSYRVAAPVPGVNVWNGWDTIEEQWVRTSGKWWYLPDQG